MADVTLSRLDIPVAERVSHFSYAIRNIAAEAQRIEAAGRKVRYLNIGNPPAFGFQPPRHLVEAVIKALRDGENGYGPSAGIRSAREAVARDYSSRGWPIHPDRVLVTAGTSEGIELTLTALLDEGSEVLLPSPNYPLYSAVISKLGARAVGYRCDPDRGWSPDLDHLSTLVSPATRALVVIDPNNPTGASYATDVRRRLVDFADRHALPILADEVYGDLGYAGPIAPLGSLDPDAAVISFSSLSKGYLAPGWRAGWLAVGRSSRLDRLLAAMQRLADGRLCSTIPVQHAISAALDGDRSHQVGLRAALAERAALTATRLAAIPGVSCVAPCAAFYAMPRVMLPPGKTDIDFVLGLLRATGILCVYGSGFGLRPADGYFRVVFLAQPDELRDVYEQLASFTASFLEG